MTLGGNILAFRGWGEAEPPFSHFVEPQRLGLVVVELWTPKLSYKVCKKPGGCPEVKWSSIYQGGEWIRGKGMGKGIWAEEKEVKV